MTFGHDDADADQMAVVRARLNEQVGKVVVGQSHVVDATLVRRSPAPGRPARSGKDAAGFCHWPGLPAEDAPGPVHARHAAV